MKHFTLCLLLITYTLSINIQQFIKNKEQAVEHLCKAVEDYYDSTQNTQFDLAYCPYYDGCLRSDMKNIPGLHCRKGFGSDTICGCDTNATEITFEHATVRFAPTVERGIDDVTRFLCGVSAFNKAFKENVERDPSMANAWQYIGAEAGVSIQYPGSKYYMLPDPNSQYGCRIRSSCDDFDSRFRPWYVLAASNGAMHVIIIFNISPRIHGTRLDIVKDAVKIVINGLTDLNYVAIIHTNDIKCNGRSYRMNAENKKFLIECIDSIEPPTKMINSEKSFTTAFDLIDLQSENATICETAILYISDLLDYISSKR